MKKTYLFLILHFLISTTSYCSSRYLLCGPDEDGCPADIYPYCACIPYNELEANNRYCLDFDKLSCTPLSETTHCAPDLIFKSQGECLATLIPK